MAEIKKSKDPWLEMLQDPTFVRLIQTLTGKVSHNAPQEVLLLTADSQQYDTIIRQMIERECPPNFQLDIKRRNKAVQSAEEAGKTGIESKDALYADGLLWLAWLKSEGSYLLAMRYAFLLGQAWGKSA